ncbi:3097_t:CDS:2, partial [Entrophospora sp. SA101]
MTIKIGKTASNQYQNIIRIEDIMIMTKLNEPLESLQQTNRNNSPKFYVKRYFYWEATKFW